MPRTFQQAYDELAALYDPQQKILQQQQVALPGQQQAELAGLDQAKTNAFSDITDQANNRGMLYSGAPIQEQQRYVGERYLPARAGVMTSYNDRTSKLESAMLDAQNSRRREAMGIVQDEQKAEADALYKKQQVELQKQKVAKAVDPAKGYKASRDEGGGLAYRDANGNPITSAQYYEARGATGIGAIIADLRSSQNPKDKAIAEAAASGKYTYDQLAKKWPEVFGGV